MLIGKWRNIDELEESLNLDELKLIIEAARERELRNQKFFAAINGIDLDKAGTKQAEEDFLRVQRRVEARMAGKTEKEVELNEFGFEFEAEDEEE